MLLRELDQISELPEVRDVGLRQLNQPSVRPIARQLPAVHDRVHSRLDAGHLLGILARLGLDLAQQRTAVIGELS